MTPYLSRGAEHAEHNRSPEKEANGHADLRGVWPADSMRVWGAARVPICAGCDEVLDTRAAGADAEDLKRQRVDPEYDHWLRRQGL